jgi:hypothetical protein
MKCDSPIAVPERIIQEGRGIYDSQVGFKANVQRKINRGFRAGSEKESRKIRRLI